MQFILSHYMYQFNIKSGMRLVAVLSLVLMSACNKTAFTPAANNNQGVGGLSSDQNPVREPANEPPSIPKECILVDGTVIPHLGTVALYRSAQSNNCDAIKQVRTCADGVLSGSNSYQYLKCDPTGCELNGKSIAHGESVTVYKASNLPYGSRCESESRTCSYGQLSGSYTNESCTVAQPSACSFNGQSVAHGASKTAYQTSSVAYGSQCVSQQRTCTNGQLSGNYTNASCTVAQPSACTFDGKTVAHNASVTSYQTSSVAYGSQCVSQQRTCTNGQLSGNYTNASCTVAQPSACTFDGKTVAHNASVTSYQTSSVAYGSQCVSQQRTCTNGQLSGSYTNASCTVAQPSACSFNGESVAHGASKMAYQTSSVAYGSQCVSQQRTCTNGQLSGSYTNASCTVGQPSACSFNGQSVAHGASKTAYQTSSVAYGSQCVSQQRTCTNGQLSGSYTNASCTVADRAPAAVEKVMQFKLHCSTGMSSGSRNLLSSPGPFTYGVGSCKENQTLTIDQIKSKQVSLYKCSDSVGELRFYDVNGSEIIKYATNNFLFDINSGLTVKNTSQGIFMNNAADLERYFRSEYFPNGNLDYNKTLKVDTTYFYAPSALSRDYTTVGNQLLCDTAFSPLFVDLTDEDRSRNHGIMLSAPWNGVWFDIMGQNAKPKAHTPMKISWFKDKLNKIAYITLPNSKGEVRGIDQLFGDNTYGPDGKFASNGFTALAKYDHNKDGRIDEDDSIYEKLRLWIDYNNDGKADPSELTGTLRDYEIEMIDLNYDHNYLEKDKYGNEIKYKSVALRKSYNPEDKQRFFMVFDIWFESSHMKAMLTEMLHQQGK